MFSIFLTDKQIEILDSSKSDLPKQTIFAEPGQPFPFWDYFVTLVAASPGKKLVLASTDPVWLMGYISSFFIPAGVAGGLVINDLNQLLFIFRSGRWDLPKGHGESGETTEQTALREVTEETGIDGLEITAPLPHTFHAFENSQGQFVLKKNMWYLMKTKTQKHPKPQIGENITRAEWIDMFKLDEVFANTYGSVLYIVSYALEKLQLK